MPLANSPAQVVPAESRRIGDDGFHFLFQAGLVAAAEDETGDKSVARRVASPSGMPSRIKSFVFIIGYPGGQLRFAFVFNV